MFGVVQHGLNFVLDGSPQIHLHAPQRPLVGLYSRFHREQVKTAGNFLGAALELALIFAGDTSTTRFDADVSVPLARLDRTAASGQSLGSPNSTTSNCSALRTIL